MSPSSPSAPPVESVVDTLGERTVEAFGILGNQARLAILLELWEAHDPLDEPNTLPFSELYDRIDIGDSGNFTYHLDKLVGPFVEQTEDGYRLTLRAHQILRAVLAGTLAEHETFEEEPVDVECHRCGAPVVVDYRDSVLYERCTSCEGRWQNDDRDGTLRAVYRPRAGVIGRSPQEFFRHGNTWDRLRVMAQLEGVCPDCSGAVARSFGVCEDHDTSDATVCAACGSFWAIKLRTRCEVCKADARMAPFAHIHTEPRVKAFYHAHDVDPDALYDRSDSAAIRETIAAVRVVDQEPLRVRVTIGIDGDRIAMTLDERAQVVSVDEGA